MLGNYIEDIAHEVAQRIFTWQNDVSYRSQNFGLCSRESFHDIFEYADSSITTRSCRIFRVPVSLKLNYCTNSTNIWHALDVICVRSPSFSNYFDKTFQQYLLAVGTYNAPWLSCRAFIKQLQKRNKRWLIVPDQRGFEISQLRICYPPFICKQRTNFSRFD